MSFRMSGITVAEKWVPGNHISYVHQEIENNEKEG